MNNYICMICKTSGSKNEVPYKIIDIRNDMTKFKGQLCDRCYSNFIEKKEINKDAKNT